jgi:hypothetical protein
MATLKPVEEENDPWETGELGRDEEHVARSTPEEEALVDDAMGLKMISIRLPKELIEELKLIAEHRGMGYQPLMRTVLKRFARSEMLAINIELTEELVAMETKEKLKGTGS